jgi:DNA-binding GntR family transcriptional regulator
MHSIAPEMAYNPRMRNTNSVDKRTRAAAEIVATVERQILSGALAPGQRVDELALAKEFGVSRTPVREALLELAAVGLVEQRAHRGAFVADVTLEEIFDVYEVLAELEGLCARLAARRMDEVERAELLRLHQEMGQLLAPEHRAKYIDLDYQFHGLLIRGARNSALLDHISMCMKRIAPVRRTSMEMVRNMETAHAEHSKLANAIIDGDAEGAERIMTEHVALRAEQAKDLVARWKTRRTAATTASESPPGPDSTTGRVPVR